jgi:hypothetical protein
MAAVGQFKIRMEAKIEAAGSIGGRGRASPQKKPRLAHYP